MKTQLMVALTISLISTSGYSVTGRDSWQNIRASREVLIQQPTFAGAFGSQGLFNACATEDEFRSLTPVQSCLSYHQVTRQSEKGPYKDYDCTEYETRHVVISRTFTQEECVKFAPMTQSNSGECLEYDNVTSVYPTSFQLVVIDSQQADTGRSFIFSKPYRIPACN